MDWIDRIDDYKGLAKLRAMLKAIGIYDWIDGVVAVAAVSIWAFLIWAFVAGVAALGPR